MEERAPLKPHSKAVRCFFSIGIMLVLLSAFACFVLFQLNQFAIEIRLRGENAVSLEYGESYEEPGVEVILKGSLFLKDGIIPEEALLQISGEVDESKVGSYTISYSADYYWFHEEAERTVKVIDTKPPVITLKEAPENTLAEDGIYQEAGYSAWDNYDGDITNQVILTHSLGKITYVAIDSSGNLAYVDREVPYHDPIPPKIHLEGGESYAIPTGTQYTEPGYTAEDNVDGDLTAYVAVEGYVDWLRPGTYPITYTVSDARENVTTVTRNVEVTAAPRPEIQWPEDKTIYLTFDDGPGENTERLLDILDAYGVKATFFVVDSDYRHLLKEITDRGHSIGIHSLTHTYERIYASPEAYFDDLVWMQQLIYDYTGVRTTLMRFPGGSSNKVSHKTCEGIMTILTEAVQDAGFQYFDWNVDSDDAGKAHDTQTVKQNVIDGIRESGTAVVLQHDIRHFSVDAVEDIIVWGLSNGYTFRPLTPNSPPFHHDVVN